MSTEASSSPSSSSPSAQVSQAATTTAASSSSSQEIGPHAVSQREKRRRLETAPGDACPICAERFSLQALPVQCPACSELACTVCVKRYLLEQQLLDGICMHCQQPWDRSFLCTVLSPAWVNTTYKKHTEDVLWEQQKAMMPDTQARMVCIQNITHLGHAKSMLTVTLLREERAYQKRREELREQIQDQRNRIRRVELFSTGRVDGAPPRKTILATLPDGGFAIRYGRTTIQTNGDEQLWYNGVESMNEAFAHDTSDGGAPEEAAEEGRENQKGKRAAGAYTTRGHCPRDGCRGFIEEGWRCGVCGCKVCRSCMVEIGDDENKAATSKHACKREDLEAVELIRASTKPCPTCRMRIQKISGCNQMFCTQCHARFDWATGKLLKGVFFHNPHFVEYMRENRLQPEELNRGACHVNYLQLRERDRTKAGPLQEVLRRVLELEDANSEAVMTRMTTRHEHDMFDLRCAYLRNEIDEDGFKLKLQRKYKALRKKREDAVISRTYATIARDILRRYVQADIEDALTAQRMIREAAEVANKAFAEVGKQFGQQPGRILV